MSAPDRDGERIYHDGDPIGSIHRSKRSRRWFFKHKAYLSAARYHTPEDAEKALREVAA